MWRIDRDYLNPVGGPDTRVGRTESTDVMPPLAVVMGESPYPGLPSVDEDGVEYPLVRFRLLDDDREVYYGGLLHDDPEALNQTAALRFGEGDAGCTIIEMKRGEKWEVEIG